MARKFFMLETGAPMDSIVCDGCLPAESSPDIKATELDSASVAANYAEEGGGGCDVCGAEFADVLRRVGFPDGTSWVGVPPAGTSHASVGHNGRVFEVIEFHDSVKGGDLACWAHAENYDRCSVVELRKV